MMNLVSEQVLPCFLTLTVVSRLFNFTIWGSDHSVIVFDGVVYFDVCSVLSSAFFSPSGMGRSSLGAAFISDGSSLFPYEPMTWVTTSFPSSRISTLITSSHV